MLRSFTVKHFKSYQDATLPLAELTVLIGANASGKSNLIEALHLLTWIAQGRRLGDLLAALSQHELAVRGTTANLAWADGGQFELDCALGDVETEVDDLRLQLTLRSRDDGLHVQEEKLWSLESRSSYPLYQVEEPAHEHGSELQVSYNNFARGGKKPRIACIDQQAIFTQLTTPARFANAHLQSQERIPAACERLRLALQTILFLDPVPSNMRAPSFLAEKSLRGDGSNVSAVLHDICSKKASRRSLLEFVRSLPEQDIAEIDFLAGLRNDVLVRLHESFGGALRWVDAPLLSDGTLRVLAVAAALLSVPEGSLVVIEEIDNGVHPSRAESLITNIQRVARARHLRVLLTTHNPALLDAIPLPSIQNVVACYRDPEQGDSRLVRLADLERYPELVAQGRIGQLVTRGTLDRFLKASAPAPGQRAQQLFELLAKDDAP